MSSGDDKEAVAGALVVLSCSCLKDEIQVYSNARGVYSVSGLPAGLYTVQGFYDDQEASSRVELQRGGKLRAHLGLRGGRRAKDTVLVVRTPVDTRTPTTVTRITGDELRIQNGGDGINNDGFSGVMDLVPTSNDNGPRKAMVGLSDAEQNYSVNGHNANDATMGAAGAAIIREFVAEAEVLEAGYEAEHGNASGGQINVRRLAGTNDLRGTAGVRFSPRLADPRTILATDEALRVTQNPDYGGGAYVAISGPIVEDRLFYSVGLNFSGAKHTLTQSFYHRVDLDDSGGYADCPYENGTNDCVTDGNYIASQKFADQKFATGGVQIGWLGGLDWRIRPQHTLGLTVLGGPSFSKTSYRLPFSVDPVAFGTNPDAALGGSARIATGIVDDHFGTDLGISNLIGLEYHGRALDGRMEIDAQVSYWQGSSQMAWRLEDPSQRTRPATQEQTANGRSLIEYLDREGRTSLVPGVESACNDATLPGNACPVRTWVSGGLGQYERDVARRVEGSLDLTHFVDSKQARGGSHQVKYGASVGWLQRQSQYQYSGSNAGDFMDHGCTADEVGGGEYCYSDEGGYRFTKSDRVNNHRYAIVDGNNPDNITTFGYGTARHETGELRALADPLGRGARVDGYEETLSTMNYGVYLQDRWAVTPSLVLTGGVRWELQDMRDIYGRSQVLIWDNVAPRVGAVYDWTQEGRSKLYASYGWFYQPLPLQLNSRAFGGLVQVTRGYQNSDCYNRVTQVNDDAHPRVDNGGQPTEWCVDGGGSTTGLTGGAVAPGLKGPYNQQFQLGYEQELVEDLVVNMRWVHQDLGRAVEDVSTNGGTDFIIANPGREVSKSAIAAQDAMCAELEAKFEGLPDDADDRGQLARELSRCEFTAGAFRELGSMFPKPIRTLDAYTVQLTRRLAKGWSVRASYTYSRNVGNYDGYTDPVNGSINLGASTQYDTPELVRNSYGPLTGTVPHMLNLDGIYSFDLRRSGRLTLATNVRVRSGVPISVRTDSANAQYRGAYLTYLLPRGAGGRVETNYRVNLTASYTYPLKEDLELEFIGRIVNVTNAKAALRVDEVYSFDGARPIAGGDIGDLKHAKVHRPGGGSGFFNREIVQPQGNFGVETRFQQPVSAQFELALRF
ncbi:Oar protein [Enhygromyxa salina]|uniref:Oar protein n=1 Tax=Enhygromyxa salina TaxID=215803 RepID=A0A0C2CZI4_9BACT|nr:TonB-dependent receptor [Enhygromyxa salina]KIG15045.1 Oar protein [Enhygromyxa salina]